MSRRDLQQAVLETLREDGRKLSVEELFEKVRSRPGFPKDAVSDFELQSALLAILAIGWAKSTVTSQVFADAAATR